MSLFIDLLKQLSQVESQPMGFRKEKVYVKPRLLLIARIGRGGGDIQAGHLNGADAGILTIKQGSDLKKFKTVGDSAKNIPWGIWIESSGDMSTKYLVEAGCDFIAFPAETPVEATGDGRFGKVLLVEASLEAGLLKTIEELPVDAVIITGEQVAGETLNWHHLMLFKRFVYILNRPLLVPVSSAVTSDGLQTIWELGASGVVVDVTAGQSVDEFKRLSKLIGQLTPPSNRGRKKMRAIIPGFREEVAPIADEEDED